MDIHIERLKKEDYEKIPLLYKDSFEDDPWDEDWYKIKEFDKDAVFVANVNEEMVGFIISFLSKGSPYISVLAVKKSLRRKGIAKALLDKCLNHWKAYDKVTLHVEKKRLGAIAFYQNSDFVTTGETNTDYMMEYYQAGPFVDLPVNINHLVKDKPFKASNIGLSGSSVRLYDDLVLKTEKTSVESNNEYTMLRWLQDKLPVPTIIAFEQENNYNYLLMSKVEGFMTYEETLLSDPKKAIKLLADALKLVFKVDIKDCPTSQSLTHKLALAEYRVEQKLVAVDDFDDEIREICGVYTPREIIDYLKDNQPLEELKFSHGDFCLPNIFFKDSDITGFIDLGRAGVADIWTDISLCIRSLRYNLKDDFKEEYIDLLLSSLEIEFNEEKYHYYLLLDELF